jgi:NADH:ubiquinone oxidoreductase subunit K
MLTLTHFLTLGALLFSLSVTGIFLNRKNVIILLMCIELMLLAVNINFVALRRSAWRSWSFFSATARPSTWLNWTT